MATAALQLDVEDKLRAAAKSRSIRVSEFFKDYDTLRSGFITRTQFQRSLDQHLGLHLSDEECMFLAGQYDTRHDGTVNYVAFCNNMEKALVSSVVDGKLLLQMHSTMLSPPSTLNHDERQLTDDIINKCREYYQYHGISVKACYADFDRHNRGFVSSNQFRRNFPGPVEVTPVQVSMLIKRYLDPSSGLCNYLHFHTDMTSVGGAQATGGGAQTRRSTGELSLSPTQLKTAPGDTILCKIRDAVYKNGIRTTEFFKDHDKLRSGIITETQFTCGLTLCCGQAIHLSREEIALVVECFRAPDGRVRYNQFCQFMENAYNVPELEKAPTQNVERPLKGHLHKTVNTLNQEWGGRLSCVLDELKAEISRRRLLLYPFFKDFDKGKGYTRGVTRSQFERILHLLGLRVSQEDMQLIVTKFADPSNGDVCYPAFIQAIDEQYVGQVMEREKMQEGGTPPPTEPRPPVEPVDVAGVVVRLQQHVFLKRVRVAEHFEDFDPLRSGSITAARFRRGITSLGQPYLTDAQFIALCDHYADPQLKEHIRWRAFLEDIDKGFGSADHQDHLLQLPPLGATDFAAMATNPEKSLLDGVLFRLSERVCQKRILVKPCFQDFDRHHIGYVSSSQCGQCLGYLDLPVTKEEGEVLRKAFSDAKGFNYLRFLDHVECMERGVAMPPGGEQRKEIPTAPPTTPNINDVMTSIKTKIGKRRISLQEFMRDYDKFKCGRIRVTLFRRALDLAGLGLTPGEVALLEESYCSLSESGHVDYISFCDEVESIFTTKQLEKMPTAHVTQYVIPNELEGNVLSQEEDTRVNRAVGKMAEVVRARRIQLPPLFQDYDRVNIGSVTTSQFHRVLSELQLESLVDPPELQLICQKFCVKVGGRADVNYIAFCQAVEKWSE
eukprot:Em0002g1841a